MKWYKFCLSLVKELSLPVPAWQPSAVDLPQVVVEVHVVSVSPQPSFYVVVSCSSNARYLVEVLLEFGWHEWRTISVFIEVKAW